MKIPSPIPRRRTRIVIIPLIDIMFFLLASFMMISLQMSRTENIKVNLPSATQAAQDYKPDMVNIAVDKSGAVWLEKKQIRSAGLGAVLMSRFNVGHEFAGLYQRRPRHAARRHGEGLSNRPQPRASRMSRS